MEHWDIGFALLPQEHGKGYAYEGAMYILKNTMPVQHSQFLATVISSNIISVKLLEKMGLYFEKEIVSDTGPLMLFSAEAKKYCN